MWPFKKKPTAPAPKTLTIVVPESLRLEFYRLYDAMDDDIPSHHVSAYNFWVFVGNVVESATPDEMKNHNRTLTLDISTWAFPKIVVTPNPK